MNEYAIEWMDGRKKTPSKTHKKHEGIKTTGKCQEQVIKMFVIAENIEKMEKKRMY